MKKMLQKLNGKYGIISFLNLFAFMTMIGSANTACTWLHHQPEMPDEVKGFRKF
ncbi:MAG: cyclic lactone autoinducer peptide [Kineothrix sp.]